MKRLLLAATLLVALPASAAAHHVPVPEGRLTAAELTAEFIGQRAIVLEAVSLYQSTAGMEAATALNDVENGLDVGIEHMRSLSVRDCLEPVRRAFLDEFKAAAHYFRLLREDDLQGAAAFIPELQATTDTARAFADPGVIEALCR